MAHNKESESRFQCEVDPLQERLPTGLSFFVSPRSVDDNQAVGHLGKRVESPSHFLWCLR